METMQQIKREHKKSGGEQSLKAFAKANGVSDIVKRAHAKANKGRNEGTAVRTRAATQARREKKGKKS